LQSLQRFETRCLFRFTQATGSFLVAAISRRCAGLFYLYRNGFGSATRKFLLHLPSIYGLFET
jgi:hypothetical protein